MRTTVTACVAGVLLAATLAGCSGGAASGSAATGDAVPATQDVTVHVTDALRFEPATVTVHVGRVRLTLIDDGSYPHNLSVAALRRTTPTVSGDLGGRRTTMTLRFNRPGSYPFVCTYHASAGMRGRIVVSGD